MARTDRQPVEIRPPAPRGVLSQWLERHGISLSQQLRIVQWGLPVLLSLIVFVDEIREHLIKKREIVFSENFLAEVIFFGILGPIAVFLVLWWVRGEWRERERAQAVLRQTYNQLAEAQARLTELHRQRGELLSRVLRIQEEERRRVAREIHDELGQLLTGLSLHLRHYQETAPPEFPQMREQMAYLNDLVQQTMDQAHRIIVDLRPTSLDDYGLLPALEEELQKRLDPLGVAYQVRVTGDPDCLLPEQATAAFRIVQEAITNVIRHAHAQQVTITLGCDQGVYELLVEDDGLGLDQASTKEAGYQGMGILGMQERAAAMGGSVTVGPREPRGTRVRVLLPVASGPLPGSAGSGVPRSSTQEEAPALG